MLIRKWKVKNKYITLCKCDYCGKEFKRDFKDVERRNHQFCPGIDRICFHKYNSKAQKGRWTGMKNPHWKGGRTYNTGYVYIKKPEHPYSKKDGYIAEHRLIMEKHLGRYLKSWEIVHHKNRVRDDNRIENLELLPRNIDNTAIDKLIIENEKLREKIKILESKI